jgi:cytosine deaminase
MAYALFTSSIPSEENLISRARRGSIPFLRRPSQANIHELFINQALIEARASLAEGGIPIGCVLVRQGQIVARGRNRRIQRNSTILQAEMDCIEAAGRQPASFYHDCTLYTTLSPCAMSAGAIRFYSIPRVIIGENKTYHGDEALLRASGIQVDVLDSRECQEIIENYVKENPLVWNENTVR